MMSGGGRCGLIYKSGNHEELLSALLKTKELNIAKESEKVLEQFTKELSFEAIASKINLVIEEYH
jgi:hypothetical protein